MQFFIIIDRVSKLFLSLNLIYHFWQNISKNEILKIRCLLSYKFCKKHACKVSSHIFWILINLTQAFVYNLQSQFANRCWFLHNLIFPFNLNWIKNWAQMLFNLGLQFCINYVEVIVLNWTYNHI